MNLSLGDWIVVIVILSMLLGIWLIPTDPPKK